MSDLIDATAGQRILLVDDSPFQLLMLRRQLEKAGFTVETAQNGAEALAQLAAPLPAMVVSDCQMPVLDGYQLCRLIKDDPATRAIPVVLLTAQARGLARFWAQTCDADKFLTKSGDFSALLAAVQELIQAPGAPGDRVEPAEGPRPHQDVQLRLAQVLERRLVESALYTAIARLYRPDADTAAMLASAVELLDGLVGDGALLLGFGGAGKAYLVGVRGVDVADPEAQQLARDLANHLGLPADIQPVWRQVGQPKATPPALLQRVIAAAVPGEPAAGAVGVLTDAATLASFEPYLRLAAHELGRLLTLEQKRLDLLRLATEDALTGLHNRRHILGILEGHRKRSLRHGQPLTVCMLDIDHFKSFNDRFGHQIGDAVLKCVAHHLRTAVRDLDAVGRIGGEEFLVALPDTAAAGGLTVAERLRQSVESAREDALPAGETITISAGVAQWAGEGDSLDALVARADAALYQAKAAGRNRVEVNMFAL